MPISPRGNASTRVAAAPGAGATVVARAPPTGLGCNKPGASAACMPRSGFPLGSGSASPGFATGAAVTVGSVRATGDSCAGVTRPVFT